MVAHKQFPYSFLLLLLCFSRLLVTVCCFACLFLSVLQQALDFLCRDAPAGQPAPRMTFPRLQVGDCNTLERLVTHPEHCSSRAAVECLHGTALRDATCAHSRDVTPGREAPAGRGAALRAHIGPAAGCRRAASSSRWRPLRGAAGLVRRPAVPREGRADPDAAMPLTGRDSAERVVCAVR